VIRAATRARRQTGPTAATPALGAAGDDAAPGRGSRQPLIALALLATVVGLDQTTKWWALRHASVAYINAGSTWLIGQPGSGWYRGPVTGPVLDFLGLVLLSLARIRSGAPTVSHRLPRDRSLTTSSSA
jgi:hypothetical protein